MELEGYKRMTKYVKKSGLTIEELVTDRHRQPAKYIREKSPEILHMYDVWHVAKCKLVLSPPVFIFKGSPIPSICCLRSCACYIRIECLFNYRAVLTFFIFCIKYNK